jgi:hypothetical protein
MVELLLLDIDLVELLRFDLCGKGASCSTMDGAIEFCAVCGDEFMLY